MVSYNVCHGSVHDADHSPDIIIQENLRLCGLI
jgi:hypothetical protein